MKSTEAKKHIYDIDLKSLLRNYEKEIQKVKLISKDQPPEYFIGLLKSSIEFYCKIKRIKYEKQLQILVTPKEDGVYRYFMALSLIFLDKHLTGTYLNYHKKLFQSQTKSDDSFTEVVEFAITYIIKYSSPFDNSVRLQRIMQWVENETRVLPIEKQLLKTRKIKQPVSSENKLKWTGSPLSLIMLSEKLYLKKYINRRLDFVEVFECYYKIDWKCSIESWVYLIHRLTQEPNNYISTTLGKTSYFKTRVLFFDFCNEKEERALKFNYSKVLYNIKTRSKEKYKETRDKIDEIIRFAFSKEVKKYK